ncbi:MAG: ribonuclease H-like YkuK family protein [bacterium]|nr:ribonuclease H-like YkuK family protein [bacterium]
MSKYFNSSLPFSITAEQVVQQIIDFMKDDRLSEYRVTIGTDSQANIEQKADFVTAIVVHRIGKGARYFWTRSGEPIKFHSLRDRITREVLISLDSANQFSESLAAFKDAPKFDFEIHVDIGQNGATKVMIQELVGMIRAHNFEAKTKPESYAASNVADKHV